MLGTAVEAAKGAGRIITERCLAGFSVTTKGFRDLVTDADLAAESFILELIRKRFPAHAVLSEEAGGRTARTGYTWVVDPLDGTTNYAHRNPVFAVSIAILEEGIPVIGVVHDPSRGHTFSARAGRGARLNDSPVQVSEVAHMEHALLGLDWGRENEERGRVLNHLRLLLQRSGTLRALGSAALGLAYVAAGWSDGYFHPSLKPWDSAAGMLLVEEAGGRCTTLKGAPYRILQPDLVATNGLIHGQLLRILHGDTGTSGEGAVLD